MDQSCPSQIIVLLVRGDVNLVFTALHTSSAAAFPCLDQMRTRDQGCLTMNLVSAQPAVEMD
jgi:hypothetical protein